MGCAVNWTGEAGDADFGIAGGRDIGFLYAHGRVLKKVSSDILVDELFFEIDRWIEGRHAPPEAAEDGEAGGARDGRSVADSARVAPRPRATPLGVPHNSSADAARRSRRRGGRQPQAARARRFHPPARRGHLVVPAARLARAPEDRVDRPRGDGRDRRAGVFAPVLTPAELWQRRAATTSPRSSARGPRRRRVCLPLTHEETFTSTRASCRATGSFRRSWYQLQTKVRDEPRPRVALFRVREFVMKVAYSFDLDEAGLDVSFAALRDGTAGCSSAAVSCPSPSKRSRARWAATSRSTTSRRRGRVRTRSSRASAATTRPISRSRVAFRGPRSFRRRSPHRPRSRRRASGTIRGAGRVSLGVDAGSDVEGNARGCTTDGRFVLSGSLRGDDRLEEGQSSRRVLGG